MQSDPKQIYKLTAERTGKEEQLYKDLGTFVFASLYSKLRRPKSLITKLKGVGTWYMRRRRMQLLVEKFPPNYDLTPEDFESPLGFLAQENKREIFEIFKERLKEYDKYIEERDKVREIRRRTQVLLTKTNDDVEGR